MHLHSTSGGAGSGLSKILTMNLTDTYRKQQNVNYILYPSKKIKNDNMIVEPYNFTLCFNQIIRSSSLVTAFSNE